MCGYPGVHASDAHTHLHIDLDGDADADSVTDQHTDSNRVTDRRYADADSDPTRDEHAHQNLDRDAEANHIAGDLPLGERV